MTTPPLNDRHHALYRFYDADGVLLYIGITASVPTRLTRHRDNKPWWTHVTRIDIEHHPDRDTVLAAEKAAIKAERPRWNVVHNRDDIRPAVTIQPARHDPSNQWTFTTSRGRTREGCPLYLYWEVSCDPITDDYRVTDITPEELWREWLTRYPIDETAEAMYGPGARRIHWFVTSTDPGVLESAPFRDLRAVVHDGQTDPTALQQALRFEYKMEFLNHYSWPFHTTTGEQLHWSRLPVIDKVWRTTDLPDVYEYKGGFIQEATGWKPSAYQAYVNVHQLARMGGLYSPQGWVGF